MNAIDIHHLSKIYAGGKEALKNISLSIQTGEIFALLGPNGAGKTTLIGIVSGIVRKTKGSVTVFGKDIETDWRETRQMIGLVPQELTLNPFDTVWDTVSFQRGFYGKKRNDKLLEKILKSLSLWEKRTSTVRALSGGMKRRVLIAKALTNEPRVLFLDEPTAGVDVELRQGMWELVSELKKNGTTIILTTHYLEEAEKMADRVGIINNGSLEMVETTEILMRKMGEKKIMLKLRSSAVSLPESLKPFGATLQNDGKTVEYSYCKETSHVMEFLILAQQSGFLVDDIETRTKSLEEIFMELINKGNSSSPISGEQDLKKTENI